LIKIFWLDINTNSAQYEKMVNGQIDLSALSRSINVGNSVSPLVGTATNLTIYEVSFFRSLMHDKICVNIIGWYFSIQIHQFNEHSDLLYSTSKTF
jgi:hypothetical protein